MGSMGLRRSRSGREAIATVAVLSEPTRRRVYDHVRLERVPLTRDDVATALGIGRPIAAFHLDALAKAGLLDVDFARPAGRQGPGAGRPAKRYRLGAGEVSVQVPERRYDLAGQILAAGVRDAREGGDARAATFAAARTKGRELADAYKGVGVRRRARGRVCAVLEELGYEPFEPGEGERSAAPDLVLRLRNCPFHAVVDVDPDLVCHLNMHLLEGLLEGLAVDELAAHFAPRPGECCVQITEQAPA